MKFIKYFKAGAWILTLAGFAHAAVAAIDVFFAGAFSPASGNAITVLKATSINIAEWLKGSSTSITASAWGAYIGFAIAVGLLMGFIGLILLLAVKGDTTSSSRNNALLSAALWVSGVMSVISVLFYFWFPSTILVAGLVCFVLARFNRVEGEGYAAR